MYLPRQQIAQLYTDLIRTNHHGSAPIVILTALTVDSLCAAHILDLLLKRDFIRHQLVPIAGYSDLQKAGIQQVQTLSLTRGGTGGTVVCLGLGGAVALEEVLGLESGADEVDAGAAEDHGVEIWILDSHRPLNLENVFGVSAASRGGIGQGRPGVKDGRILPGYKPGRGGVIVFDDGDLEQELRAEKKAFFALQDMPDITEEDMALHHDEDEDEDAGDDDTDPSGDEDEDAASSGQKRKRTSSLDDKEEDNGESSDGEISRARRRRRSNSSSSIPIPSSPGGNPLSAQLDVGSTPPPMPSSPPKRKERTAKQLRRQLLKLRREHEATLDRYYDLGTKAAECVSSMLYSLASDLGREDNELLWLAIVGISSMVTSASGPGARAAQIKHVLQDEVQRLNPIPDTELQRSQSMEAIIPTTARSPTDNSIRLSPEPRFLMIRHWSLYDSMLHSPYLATRLHVWSEPGKKRLHKLLAKMGISLQEAGKGYLHMDSELKRTLRKRILKFAEQYNLDGLVPTDKGRRVMEGWGFVRSWGWRGTLSAEDVAIVIGAILEVGGEHDLLPSLLLGSSRPGRSDASYNERAQNLPTPPHSSDDGHENETSANDIPDYVEMRFSRAMAALRPGKGLNVLLENIPAAQNLYKAILRVGSALINKSQIRHLRSFRMAVVKEGPDVPLFTHPGALVRLAGWVGEAVAVLEGEQGRNRGKRTNDALVLAALDEGRGVFVVVGLGGGTGWNSSGKKIRSKAEIKEREEAKKRKLADRAARKAESRRKREEQKRLRSERMAANGMLEEDEEDESELETESEDDEEDDSEDEDEGRKSRGLNRFGQAFQEVVDETGARVRIDSFEHSVVEVKKDDIGGFLEALSAKNVVA